jgi:hypothetical protein
VKRGGSNLDHAPFERCVLETERMETRGNSLDFDTENVLNGQKKLFHHEICYFLSGKFSYAGVY